MSHNVSLKGVKVADINILDQALSEIQKEGNSAHRLVKTPCEIRGWAGRLTKVDAAIMCPHERYDIGFTKGKDGVYIPLLESGFRSGGIAAVGAACPIDSKLQAWERNAASLMGGLMQRYAVLTAERNARNLGMMTRRINNATNGQIALEVIGK